MSVLVVNPVASHSSKNWQRTTFRSDDDDDLSLLVSVYLDSIKESGEIVQNLEKVLQAYDFTNFTRIKQAPGSVFISIKVTYKTNEREEARRKKKKLADDLLSDTPPSTPRRRRAVSKLKKSLWKRAKSKTAAIIVAGSVFLGTVAADVLKDEIKAGVEKWLDAHGPKIVQRADAVISKELPPRVAKSFHEAVKNYIDKSPNATSLEPPPPPAPTTK